jgi:hypothetical protein
MPKKIKQTLPITSTPTKKTKPPKKEPSKNVHPGSSTSKARETGENFANAPTRSKPSTPPGKKKYSNEEINNLVREVVNSSSETDEYKRIFEIPYAHKTKLFKALKEEIDFDPELLAIIKFEYELHHEKHDEATKFLILNCGVFSISRPKDEKGENQKPQVSFLEGDLFKIKTSSEIKHLNPTKIKEYIQKNSEKLIKESGLFALMLLASRYNIPEAKETLIEKLNQCKEGKLAKKDPVYKDLESCISNNPFLEILDKNRHLNYVLEKLKVLNDKETDNNMRELLNESITCISPKIKKLGLMRF